MPERSGASLRIAVVGLGYTGASLGLALRRAYPSATVIGHDKEPQAAKAAQKAGAVSKTHWNLIEACDGADLVVMALPTAEVRATLEPLARELRQGVLTDTAPLKATLVHWAAANLPPGLHYVGGHPLLRRSESPSADAFTGRAYCLTPTSATDADALGIVSSVAEAVGANPMYLDAAEHDSAMAYLRQMPALAAAAALHLARGSEAQADLRTLREALPPEAVTLAGAAGPLAGTGMSAEDMAPLRAWLDRYVALLTRIRAAMEAGDGRQWEAEARSLDDARTFWDNAAAIRPDGGSEDTPAPGAPRRRLFGLR